MNSVCMWPVTVDYRTVCVHTELVLISGNVWLCACIFFSETKLWTGLPEYGGVQFGRLLTGIALFLFNTFRRLSWMPKWMGHSELNFCFSFPWTSYYIQCEASQSVCILWGIHSDAESHVAIFWCLTLASKTLRSEQTKQFQGPSQSVCPLMLVIPLRLWHTVSSTVLLPHLLHWTLGVLGRPVSLVSVLIT